MSDLFVDALGTTGATFSEDKKYRYRLWRIWDPAKPKLAFIGLNPSTANEVKDDATIRRLKGFSHRWGYGGFYMLNLFAWVTPYPQELKECKDPIGENDKWLKETADKCARVVFCWGGFPQIKGRDTEVMRMFPGAYCIGKTLFNHPRHPLYLPKTATMEEYDPGGVLLRAMEADIAGSAKL